MKTTARYFLILIALVVILAAPLIASAQQQDDNQQLKAMITELEQKIADADSRMIAHPSFLTELRELTDKYKAQLRELFFRDSFSDGNFSQDPQWSVRSGSFSVNAENRLTSFVAIPAAPAQTTPQSQGTPEQQAVGLLLNTFLGGQKQSTQSTAQAEPEPVQPASIYTRQGFPPDFEINTSFKSGAEGEMDIALLETDSLVPRYILKVKANHSAAEPMEVVRETNSREFVVGASDSFPVINDGRLHTLTWARYLDGAMVVMVDGTEILETYEVYYRDNFSGLQVTNNGGSYEWDGFEIYRAQQVN